MEKTKNGRTVVHSRDGLAAPPRPIRETAELKPLPSSGPSEKPFLERKRSKRRKRRRMLLLAACAFIAVAGGAVWQWGGAFNAGESGPATAPAQVVRRDFSSSVLATGAVKPRVGAQVRVGARISGKVVKLRANIGDYVRAGDVIAELEKKDLQATAEQRKAELDLAKAKLAAVESLLPQEIEKAKADCARWVASLARAKQELERAKHLRPMKAISETDYDAAVSEYEMDKAQLASARKSFDLAKTRLEEERKQAHADLARAKSALDHAVVLLSYATLTAPISGVIASVSTQEGETVAAGLNSPTFVTIIDLDRLEVDAMVDEVDIGKVRLGQKASFTVDSYPAREFSGEVSAIYPDAVLLENVVYYVVVIDIEGNEDEVLRPQMTAGTTIFLESKTGVPAVPAEAVKRERGKNIVYVTKDGRPRPREVKVGWKDGKWIEILAGLQVGETVLLQAPAGADAAP